MPNEHFVVPPHWEWYILLYFFFAGISGGAFVIGTMLRLWGSPVDKAASRLAFIISFPLLLICPILLTLDLGQPLRFWHMLVDSVSGTPVFKAYSPMSLGAWGLTLFGLFSFVSSVMCFGPFEHMARLRRRIGLIGMRERIELLGGRLQIESSAASGTTLAAEVPLA